MIKCKYDLHKKCKHKITCGICQRNDFKNESGLNMHIAKMHQDDYFSGHREIELYTRKASQ